MIAMRLVVLTAALVLSSGCATPDRASPSSPASEPTAVPGTATPATGPTATPRLTATLEPTATAEPAATPTVAPATPAPEPPPIGYQQIASGFHQLTLLAHAGDGSDRIYVVEQRGVIYVGDAAGTFGAQPFLDISAQVDFGGERGLLGLAFHPQYADNGRFFVNYSDRNGDNLISEFARDAESDARADPGSERGLLRIEQPFGNHNGGMLAFGADGMLYISSGDGGSAGDPLDAGQDTSTLLGKILRIDVDIADAATPYNIPPDNPFADGQAGAPEIWSYGLRNPWRFSFDRRTGDMFIGDVGQDRWEEVNAEPAGEAGRNYGWRLMEGPECFESADCDPAGLVLPVAWYETGIGCAVTGGYVYRGAAEPSLDGTYFYADYCSGDVWALEAAASLLGQPVPVHEMANAGIDVTGFGEDEAGELYVVGFGGQVLRIVAAE